MYTPHAEKSSEKRFISKKKTKFGIAGTRLPAPAAISSASKIETNIHNKQNRLTTETLCLIRSLQNNNANY